MIIIDIPGREQLTLKYLVMDFNGTIAVDGVLIPGVREKLTMISGKINTCILTADTFGTARKALEGLDLTVSLVERENQNTRKAEYISSLDDEKVAAIGNGMNDSLMLKNAALGIAVIEGEGASSMSIRNADIVCRSIHDALDLLIHTKRIVATLRN